MRSVTSRKFPVSLSSYTESNSSKLDLFNMWCDANRNWDEVKLQVQRKVEATNRAKRGWEAVQGKVLKDRLAPEKFDKLIASRKAFGMFYEDEDFPNDVDDP